MKLIKTLICEMKDEIEGCKNYSIMALEYQASRPQLAQLFHQMANQEYSHFNSLHDHTVKIVEELKDKRKDIPQ